MRIVLMLILFISIVNAELIGDWETITNMNDVRDLKYDDGTIWAATTGGLYSYSISDGEIRKFTNTDGITSIDLASIETDTHDNVIFGGNKGILEILNKADGDSYPLYNIESNSISDILFHMDTLWVAAGKGLAVFVYSDMEYRFKDFYKNFDILPNSVTTIEIFAGRIWLGTDKGLLSAPSAFDKYTINDPALWTVYNTAKGMTDNNILDLEVINDALWIGTSAGITTINSNLQLRKDENWGISDQDAANVVLTTGHRIIISKNSGEIYDYDPNTGDKILISTSGYEITNIVSDSSDDVWVGLSEGGIWQPENNNRIVLDGPGQNQIRYVIKDGSNKIWASSGKFKLTPNKGFFVFDGNSWTNIDYLDFGWSDLGNTDIIFEDHNDNVWLGSWGGGLTTYKDDQFIYFHNYENSGRRIVSSKDTVIIENMATIDSKYTGFFSGVVTYLTYEVIGTINLDNFNRLWVSNYYAANDNLIAVIPYKSDGFISLEKADWIYLGRNQNLIMEDGAISCIAFDDFNRAWIGSFKDGVFVIEYDNNGNFSYAGKLTISDNLYSNTILSIAKDQDGVMWIGTSAGLNSFDGVNVYKHVGDSEGLSGPLENQINQIVVDKYNNKWFATTGGLSILRGERSPWDETAWIGFTSKNSGLVDDNINTVFVDSDNSEALIGTEHGLSIYRGSFAEIQDDYSKVAGGPNPFKPGSQNNTFVLTNLEFNSTVNIYNLNGQLIKSLSVSNGFVDGSRAVWDGRDAQGKLVSTGVYFYLAFTDEGKSAAGKFAVIRK